MTDYTKTTNFAAKDSLPSGNSGKIVKGSEIDTEFNNIATAVATKANTAAPTLTGTVTLTGLLSVPDGTASAPSFTNTGDTNVGLFFSGTDTMAFTAGGTSQVTFADGVIAPVTTNDVDLGTSSLQFKDLFLAGNADFNGDLDVDGTTNLDVVDIDGALTQDGGAVFNQASADVDFRVETNGAINKFFIDGGNDVVVIGNNAPVSSISVNSTFQIQGNSNANSGMSISRYTSNNSGPYLNLAKSRSTSVGDNFTIVQDGDTLGRVSFVAADGNDFAHQGAKIVGALDGTPSANDVPGRLEFHTTPDGSNSPSERMRITDAGDIGIGDSAPSAKLHVTTGVQGDDAVVFESTNGGTSFGPVLNLDRNSSSPADNDLLGRIIFNGRNDADPSEVVPYARIKSAALDVTDGEEDGKLELSTILAGADTSRMEMTITETVFNEDSKDLDFRIESNGSTKKFFIDGGENVVCINTDSPRGIASTSNRQFQMEGTSGVASSFSITRNQNSNGGPALFFGKTRGTSFGDVTIAQDGDALGTLGFCAADGNDVAHQSAKIVGSLDGTPAENDVPGRLEFHTTPDGSTTLNERMRINSDGDLLINTTTDYGAKVNIARADNNVQLALVCTDADQGDGPILDFIRDSGSPSTADDIAVVNFKADDDAGNRDIYAQIAVFSPGVTSGSEQGRFVINTNDGSAGLQNRIDCTTGETVFNNGSVDIDFRVESDGKQHMLFVDAGTDTVRIGSSSDVSTAATTLQVTADSGERAADIYRPTSTGTGVIFAAYSNVGGTAEKVFEVEANGDVENATNSYSTISDQRLKQDIVDANSQWNDIKALQIRNFRFINDVNQNGEDALRHIGVVAQEVESAGMTGLVKTRNDEDTGEEIKSVKSSIIYMKAVKALQEAITRIETLEAEVTALKGGS